VNEVLHHLAASPGVDCWALLLPCWVGSSYISHAKLEGLTRETELYDLQMDLRHTAMTSLLVVVTLGS
jgi:hypothetical protein